MTETAVWDAARTHEPDRYLSALLAPRRARADLIALAAFVGEIARIGGGRHEPMLGEIKIQWRRDALDRPAGALTGSPVADAFRDVLVRFPVSPLASRLLDAHAAALYDPPGALPEAELFAATADGAAFEMAAVILSGQPSPDTVALCGSAGRAYGLARALYARAETFSDFEAAAVAAGAHIEASRKLAADAPRLVFSALLPLALAPTYLRAVERGASVTPLARVWRLWRAHRTGKF